MLDRSSLQEFFLGVVAHTVTASGGLAMSIATVTIGDGRVDVHALDRVRRRLDGIAVGGVVFVAFAWLASGLGMATPTADPPSPTLTSIHFALLAVALVAPPLCHAMLHRTLTVPPGAHVPPHPWPSPAGSASAAAAGRRVSAPSPPGGCA